MRPAYAALSAHLRSCAGCAITFENNVALVASDSGELTEEQMAYVLTRLRQLHVVH
jgi:hypothetical protein